MAKETPVACSLSASNLERRLAEIAEIGADSLIDSRTDRGRHLLRFRSDPTTRRRLTAIIAAEAKCCSFLDLSMHEQRGELVLTIDAAETAQGVSDGLAAAFARVFSKPLSPP
jgi:hypothetical protein